MTPATPLPLAGRTCLITGASMGIGHATAIGLARLGARLLIASRDPARGEAARAALVAAVPGTDATFLPLDLSSLQDVERFAAALVADGRPLHVLLNNASVITRERTVSADGIELQLAVNHVAPFFLTKRLEPLLRAAEAARIVTVASAAHRGVELDFDDLQGTRSYRPTQTYQRTKLMNILFTTELAGRLAGTGITANCLHPGVIHTELLTNFFAGPRFLRRFLSGLFGTTTEAGARTSIHLASSPAVASLTGRYFSKCREKLPSQAARDPASARRLWTETERLLGES